MSIICKTIAMATFWGYKFNRHFPVKSWYIFGPMFVILLVVENRGCIRTREVFKRERDNFQKRALSGVFISLEMIETGHGTCRFAILDHLMGDTLKPSFRFYDELEKKGIQKGDSISKRAQSDSFFVYKKIEGRYLECCAFTTVGR